MKFKTDELMQQSRLDESHSSFSSAAEVFASDAEAAKVFSILKAKLLDIDEWNAHALLTSFELFEENGEPLPTKKLSVGSFLRIALTGTLKYDWVRIVDMTDAADEFIVTVKPTFDPTETERDERTVSHFFTDESTNNFCLVKKEKEVALYVIGLSEKMNASETENALETVRNAAVNAGSYLGVQRGEWEKFCHHFMDDAAKSAAA
jgi:hypothetical protein